MDSKIVFKEAEAPCNGFVGNLSSTRLSFLEKLAEQLSFPVAEDPCTLISESVKSVMNDWAFLHPIWAKVRESVNFTMLVLLSLAKEETR